MSIFRETETTANDEELQVRNNQDHARTFDPDGTRLLKEILKEMKKTNTLLSLIYGEEI